METTLHSEEQIASGKTRLAASSEEQLGMLRHEADGSFAEDSVHFG